MTTATAVRMLIRMLFTTTGKATAMAVGIHRQRVPSLIVDIQRSMSDHANAAPRPVADAPPPALLEHTEDLAKRWALALISQRPLAQAAEIPLAELAREAPAVIALTLRSLGSDAELQQIADASPQAVAAARVGALAGASDHASAIAAIEVLRSVLWQELLAELRHPSAQLVAELASRLAHVCSVLAVCVCAVQSTPVPQQQDEEPQEPPARWESEPRPTQIEIRDARTAGPSAWIGSIGRCLRQQAGRTEPFAVELIEVIGIERLRHAEDPAQLGRLVNAIQAALHRELRPADILTRESEGRYWLVAPDTDAAGALMLAERLISVVRDSVSHRGVPLEVAIGIAIYPTDGTEAADLASQADMRLYGARAAGLSVEPATLARIQAPE